MRSFFGRSPEPRLKGAFRRCSESGVDNPAVIDVSRPGPHRCGTCGRAARRAGRTAGLTAALVALLAWPAARASDPGDHERARAAVQSGEVLPLPTLLQRLQRTHPGQVLELELERDDGRWRYEVKLLQAGGQLVKLEVDAATGQVLEARRKRADKPRPASGPSR